MCVYVCVRFYVFDLWCTLLSRFSNLTLYRTPRQERWVEFDSGSLPKKKRRSGWVMEYVLPPNLFQPSLGISPPCISSASSLPPSRSTSPISIPITFQTLSFLFDARLVYRYRSTSLLKGDTPHRTQLLLPPPPQEAADRSIGRGV